MDPAVVVGGVDVVVEVTDLRVLAEAGVVVGGAGSGESRSARACTPGRNSSAPTSQSPSAACCPSSRWRTQLAKTSETDSLRAPGWPS